MQKFYAVEQTLKDNDIYYKTQVSMKKLTSFKIGGHCKIVAYPDNFNHITMLIKICRYYKISYFFLGNGSNILFGDEDFDGIAICSKNLNKIKKLTNNKIYCEAGVSLFKLCNFACLNSLSNLEPLYGIPGSLGGAILMNAGAYGGEIKDVVDAVAHLDENGNINILSLKDLQFSYRHSIYQGSNNFIIYAILNLKIASMQEIKNKMNDILKKREEKQPLNFPSAGSIFKKPKNDFAGKLIEECGLKGETIGNAKVSEKQRGFIVNLGYATACDVKKLIEKTQKTVKIKKNTNLKLEIRYIN